MNLRHSPFGASLLLLLALAARGAGQEARFRVSTPEGILGELRLDQFAGDGLIHLSGKGNKILAATDLIWLRREGRSLPEHPPPPFVLLASGERIPFSLEAGLTWREDRLHVRAARPLVPATGKEVAFPLSSITLLCLDHPVAEEEAERAWDHLLASKREADLVLLKDGDQVEGKVQGLKGKALLVQAGKRNLNLPLDRVAALAFNPRSLKRPPVKGVFFRAVLAGGTRVDFQALRLDQERQVWTGKTAWGELEFPFQDLVALEARQGRAIFLSDLVPKDYQTEPTFGFSWPLGKDRTLFGRPLRLTDGVYEKGLSLPGTARVDFSLEGDYRWFEARAGLDPLDGRGGRVVVEVYLDDKKADLGRDGEIAGREGPWDIRVDVSGAKALSLRTRPGSRVGLGAVVNWGGARLVK